MQFKLSAAAVLAFVASTIAQTAGFDAIIAPNAWETLPAGKAFKVQWAVPAAYKHKNVAISLIGGETQGTQVPLLDIASGISNDAGEYNWVIPATLGDAKVYGLIIKLVDNPAVFQYSNPFKIHKASVAPPPKTTAAAPPKTTAAGNHYSVTSAAPPHVTKTVSLSSQAAPYTTVEVDNTVTVPCNETVSSTSVAAHTYIAPPQPSAPVITKPYGNNTWTTSIVPPATSQVYTVPPVETPITTPISSPIIGAGARVGAGSMAVLGGLLIAALAL